MARVQVGDLSAPDPIRPAPVQSDTFAAPPQPVINNDMERLASALGVLSSGVKSYLDDPERKKKHIEGQLAAFERWKASKTDTQQLELVEAGKAPMDSEPVLKQHFTKHYSEKRTMRLADELDAEVRELKIPDWGTDHFDPDAYFVQRSAQLMKQYGDDPTTAVTLGPQLEALKEKFKGAHERALAENHQLQFKDSAYTQLDAAVTNAFEAGATGQETMDLLRVVYKELGPRAGGGSLNMRYAQQDDLLLEVLEKKARDPRFAVGVMELLSAQRLGEDGNADHSLDKIGRHGDKLASIGRTAIKVLGDEEEGKVKSARVAELSAAFMKGDASYGAMLQYEFKPQSKWDSSRTFGMSKAEQEEAVRSTVGGATQAAIDEGKPGAVDEQMDAFIRNDIKHPALDALARGYNGFLNTIATKQSPQPDQIEQIRAAALVFNEMATKRAAIPHMQKHLSKPEFEFYTNYNVLTRHLGYTDEAAAAVLATEYSNPDGGQDVTLSSERQYEVREQVGKLDWSWLPFTAGVNNPDTAYQDIRQMAEGMIKFQKIDPTTAVTAATTRFQENAMHVNGHAFMPPPGLRKDAEVGVVRILEDQFAKNPKGFKELGISKPEQLSVMPLGNGTFMVINAETSMPVVIRDGDTRTPLKIGQPLIQATTTVILQEAAAKAQKEAKDAFDRRQNTLWLGPVPLSKDFVRNLSRTESKK